MIATSAWATKWYITLFVNTVPFSTQLRIWDAMLLDGRDVVVITALAILWAYKGEPLFEMDAGCLSQTLPACTLWLRPNASDVSCRRREMTASRTA